MITKRNCSRSIAGKVLAAVAALVTVGGGAAGVLGTAAAAHAATPSCGSTCVDIFNEEFGHHHSPGFLLDVYQGRASIGQPLIFYRASTSDPAEDFRAEFQGTVLDFYRAGLVSAAFARHYGCVPDDKTRPGDFPDCFGTGSPSTTRRSRSSTPRTGWTPACARAWPGPRPIPGASRSRSAVPRPRRCG